MFSRLLDNLKMNNDDLLLEFENIDYDEIINGSITFEIENENDLELCCFKECLQLKSTNHFCNDHYDMVYRPRKKQKYMTKSDDQCAAKRCFKKHEEENYLCFEHIMAKSIKIQNKFQCDKPGCESIKKWKSCFCLLHD